MEKSMTMKYSSILTIALLMLGLMACNQHISKPDQKEPTYQKGQIELFMVGEAPPCLIPEDAKLDPRTFFIWDSCWASKREHFPAEVHWQAYPYFGVSMEHFRTYLMTHPEYHGFRLYFGINDTNQPLLWMAHIGKEGSCSPLLNDNMLVFAPAISGKISCPTDLSKPYCQVDSQTGHHLAKNWRNYWGVSLTDTLCVGCAEPTKIPLAYNVNSQSMLDLLNAEADSVYIFLGLKEHLTLENESYWELKIIFEDINSIPKEPGGLLDYSRIADFAAPCPKQCGSEEDSDPLLTGQ
jgi:hypothetical protein